MPNFDIPIIATVKAKNIDEARQLAYKAVKTIENPGEDAGEKIYAAMVGVDLTMADDTQTDAVNQRIVFLHPIDVEKDYDVDSYNEALEKEKE